MDRRINEILKNLDERRLTKDRALTKIRNLIKEFSKEKIEELSNGSIDEYGGFKLEDYDSEMKAFEKFFNTMSIAVVRALNSYGVQYSPEEGFEESYENDFEVRTADLFYEYMSEATSAMISDFGGHYKVSDGEKPTSSSYSISSYAPYFTALYNAIKEWFSIERRFTMRELIAVRLEDKD